MIGTKIAQFEQRRQPLFSLAIIRALSLLIVTSTVHKHFHVGSFCISSTLFNHLSITFFIRFSHLSESLSMMLISCILMPSRVAIPCQSALCFLRARKTSLKCSVAV